jgi:hypothetical protein
LGGLYVSIIDAFKSLFMPRRRLFYYLLPTF